MATILFACFIAEHNLPFTTADNLMDLMKRMFPDSAIAQSLSMKRTKCTDVIKTMGRTVTNSLAKKLRTSKFSVIMDESTDVSTIKSCAVIVRFYDSSVQKITTAMLDLVNIYDSDNNAQGSTGQNLYSLLINTLTKYDIPLSNFIGFAADGASNIMGEHNSLCSRLKHLLPGLTVFKCIYHSIHLCSSGAAKTLPRHCEDLLRSIYTFFAHSSKRQYDFKLSQEFCNTKPHKILHPSQTRWLSLHEAVRRVLEQWQPLTLYFSQIEGRERLTVVHQIDERMRDPAVFLYFTFLDYILPKFNDFNLLFQRNYPTFHLLFDKITKLYRSILGTFCQPHILQKQSLMAIDPCNESNYVPLNQLYLGAELHILFQKESLKILKCYWMFKTDAENFVFQFVLQSGKGLIWTTLCGRWFRFCQ
ncbi:uncharacterized protein [Palaemon carinicauda]|uniref:uncharacterized protein n=1 Tax=Palaemon carinicauda TaxID=392227 RepID=UPI0035B5BC1D